MSAAVEIAWRRGLVVVAASGNGGPQRDTVVDARHRPVRHHRWRDGYRGTVSRRDDMLAWFSAWGSADSNAKPDLVAPGRRLVSLRVPGAPWIRCSPTASWRRRRIDLLPLTGTSMATGVVSGAAALLLQGWPNHAGPDQGVPCRNDAAVRQDSGKGLPDPIADGSGLLDAFAAMIAARDATEPDECSCRSCWHACAERACAGRVHAERTPTWGALAPRQSRAPARGRLRPRAVPGPLWLPLHWKDPTFGGIPWFLLTWDTLVWNSIAWDNFAWDSVAWDSVAWDSIAWDSIAWDSIAWDSVAWDSVAWDSFTLD